MLNPKVEAVLKGLKFLERKLDEAYIGKLTENDGVLQAAKMSKEAIMQGKILEAKGVLFSVIKEVKDLY